ncbi:hypothetical protein B296_00041381, partial [Ensete ventricosum]
MVPPKIDNRRSISTVDSRLREIKDQRKREEGEETEPLPSPPVGRPHPVALALSLPGPASDFSPARGDGTSPHARRRRNVSPREEKDRGD